MVTKYERALAGKKHQLKKWLLSSRSNRESSICFIQTPIIQIPAICQIMSWLPSAQYHPTKQLSVKVDIIR